MNPFRKVSPEQYSDPDFPPNPAKTLIGHVATKGLQAGSVVGLCLTPAISHFKKMQFQEAWMKTMPRASLSGLFLSLTMLAGKATSATDMDEHGVDDRAYRISRNEVYQLIS
jgi:hypothetical protein